MEGFLLQQEVKISGNLNVNNTTTYIASGIGCKKMLVASNFLFKSNPNRNRDQTIMPLIILS